LDETEPKSGLPGPTAIAERPGPTSPAEGREPATVLLLNHRRDPLRDALQALRRAGHRAVEARSLAESQRALEERCPDLVVLNPVVLKTGGVELGLAEQLQTDQRPVPVLLMVEEFHQLDAARALRAPIRDFVFRPARAEEIVHRIEGLLRLRGQMLDLHARARELEDQASTDHKTGLYTDRYFRQVLQIEFKRALRHQMPLSMLWIDIDDFKAINDGTSYAFGDAVLRQVAQTLRHGIRETDYASRFGGDEFTLLLPHTTPAEAVQTAIRIRKQIARQVVQGQGFARTVTLSIGIDTFGGQSESTPDDLRARANKALHVAKRRGKNQVWLYDGDEAAASPARGEVAPDERQPPAADGSAGA
jgi:diguanylate cyclase (GGDEF)-like protein